MTAADYRRDFKKGLICGRLEAVGSSQKIPKKGGNENWQKKLKILR